MDYGRLTIENEQVLTEKAKTKKDGVYTLRGIAYAVKDGVITHYALYDTLIQRYAGFNVDLGKFSGGESSQEYLKRFIKNNS